MLLCGKDTNIFSIHLVTLFPSSAMLYCVVMWQISFLYNVLENPNMLGTLDDQYKFSLH